MPIILPKKPNSSKALIESALKYNEKLEKAEKKKAAIQKANADAAIKETSAIVEASAHRSRVQSRYATFSENVKINLLADSIIDLTQRAMISVNESLNRSIFGQKDIYTNVPAITYQFIRENGSGSGILYNMENKNPTSYSSSLARLIKTTHRSVLESLGDRPYETSETGDFAMDKADKEEFCRKRNKIFGHDELVQSIADRVADAIKDFIQQNTEDKERIVDALSVTKDKIDSIKDAPDSVKESYLNIGRRYIADIREKKHGVLNEMVVAMSKGVMKNEALREEFVHDAHLDVGKILSKVSTMYTFLETVNTARIVSIDEAFMKDVLKSLEE